jgi:hypothetical protein
LATKQLNGDMTASAYYYFPDIKFTKAGFSKKDEIFQSSVVEVSVIRAMTTDLMVGRNCGSFIVHALASFAICNVEK